MFQQAYFSRLHVVPQPDHITKANTSAEVTLGQRYWTMGKKFRFLSRWGGRSPKPKAPADSHSCWKSFSQPTGKRKQPLALRKKKEKETKLLSDERSKSRGNTIQVTRGAGAQRDIKSRIHPNTVKCQNLKSVTKGAKMDSESQCIARLDARGLHLLYLGSEHLKKDASCAYLHPRAHWAACFWLCLQAWLQRQEF